MTADQIFHVHRRLGNQMPCRYYLDAKGDGSYSHVCLELHFTIGEDGRIYDAGPSLQKELATAGFTVRAAYRQADWPFPLDGREKGWFVRRYFAERTYEKGEARQL